MEHCRSHKPKPAAKPPKAAKPITKMTLKRRLPEQVRKAIVFLVYGAGTYTTRIRSYAEVAKIFTISPKTVESVISTFKKRGCSLEEFKDRRLGRPSSIEQLDPAVKRQLLRRDLLQLWATKTLAERVSVINRDYNVDMTVWKLRKLYIENGIKPRSTQMVYRSQWIRRHELDAARFQFVKGLLQAILDAEPFAYFD